MKNALAVARELADTAKSSLSELRDGEKIRQEWLKDGIYCRETILNGKTFLAAYDFHKRAVMFPYQYLEK